MDLLLIYCIGRHVRHEFQARFTGHSFTHLAAPPLLWNHPYVTSKVSEFLDRPSPRSRQNRVHTVCPLTNLCYFFPPPPSSF